MTQENLEIIVTNGYCCSAQKAVELSKLLSLGNICTDKKEFELLILNNALNTLKEYSFTGKYSKHSLLYVDTDYEALASIISSNTITYYIKCNNLVYSKLGDNIKSELQIILELLESTEKFIKFDPLQIGLDFIFSITMSCDTELVELGIDLNAMNSFIINTIGNCTLNNCLTEEELDKLTHTVMNICDICDCQLK